MDTSQPKKFLNKQTNNHFPWQVTEEEVKDSKSKKEMTGTITAREDHVARNAGDI